MNNIPSNQPDIDLVNQLRKTSFQLYEYLKRHNCDGENITSSQVLQGMSRVFSGRVFQDLLKLSATPAKNIKPRKILTTHSFCNIDWQENPNRKLFPYIVKMQRQNADAIDQLVVWLKYINANELSDRQHLENDNIEIYLRFNTDDFGVKILEIGEAAGFIDEDKIEYGDFIRKNTQASEEFKKIIKAAIYYHEGKVVLKGVQNIYLVEYLKSLGFRNFTSEMYGLILVFEQLY